MSVKKAVKSVLPASLFEVVAPAWHWLEAFLAQLSAGFPARKLSVIGVTGTDGKTTTCFFIHSVLNQAGLKTAMITTAGVDLADGNGVVPSPTQLTTASPGQLAKMIKAAKQNGAKWLVLEVSSHALHQNRVLGIPFTLGVFTNLSHEHLDYHKNFENYLQAKLKLFELINKNKSGLRAGVVNADDAVAAQFSSSVAKSLTYGIEAGELRAVKVKLTPAGSRFAVKTEEQELRIDCRLPGRFNIYNSLAAVAVGNLLSLGKEDIEKGIIRVDAVAGRMQRVNAGQDFEAVVDYAVTPAALQSVLESARQTAKGRVILVFGATGNRDKQKRPVMGEVAAKGADLIFLTDDEPYTENPENIRAEVMAGIQSAGGEAKTREIGDRLEAIKAAIKEAKAGDVVLLTGIGHQKYRNVAGQKQPWNEVDIAKKIITGQS